MGTIARQSFFASISNYLGIGIGLFNNFLLFPLVFSEAQNGVIRLFIEGGALLANLAALGTGYSIWRFFPLFKNDAKKHHGAGFWIVAIPAFGFLMVSLFILFGKSLLLGYFGANAQDFSPFYYYLIPFVFFFCFNSVFEVFQSSLGNIVVANILRENVVRIMLGLLGFVYYLHCMDFDTSVKLIPLVYAMMAILNFSFILKKTPIGFKPDMDFIKNKPGLVKEFSIYSFYLFGSYLASLLIQRLDFFMVSSKLNFAFTGIYAIAFNLAMLIEIPMRNILQISNPKLSEYLNEGNHDKAKELYEKTSLNQFILGAFLFLVIWINIDAFYMLMPNGTKYAPGMMCVFYLGIGKLILLLQGNAFALLSFSKKYWLTLLINAAGLTIGIVGNNYLIPKLQIEGAAIATACTWLVNTLMLGGMVYAIYGFHPIRKNALIAMGLFLLFLGLAHYFNFNWNVWVGMGIKTVLFGFGFMAIIYQMKISQDINSIVDKLKWRVISLFLNKNI